MNRTPAIIITVASAFLCGCPGLALAALGVMAALGSQMPEMMAQNQGTPQEALFGAGIFICFGAVLMLIPIIVGILSIRTAKTEEPNINEAIPPVS